jgi:hypothetical protein
MEVELAQARARGEVRERGRLLGGCDALAGAAHRLDLGSGAPSFSGRQRLQARKPARSAASPVKKKDTFSRFAGRDAQLGRQ